MPRFFVTDAPVAVYEHDGDAGGNVVYVKSKMDVQTRAAVTSDLFAMSATGTVEARLGANDLAMLVHNIVRWDGPDFAGFPCTAENIRRLDASEPLIRKVLDTVASRNRPPEAPVPNSPAAGGSTSAGSVATAAPSERTTASVNGHGIAMLSEIGISK